MFFQFENHSCIVGYATFILEEKLVEAALEAVKLLQNRAFSAPDTQGIPSAKDMEEPVKRVLEWLVTGIIENSFPEKIAVLPTTLAHGSPNELSLLYVIHPKPLSWQHVNTCMSLFKQVLIGLLPAYTTSVEQSMRILLQLEQLLGQSEHDLVTHLMSAQQEAFHQKVEDEAHLIPVKNFPGKETRIVSIAHSGTGPKETRLLAEQEPYFIQKVVETIPDVITLYDLQKKKNLYGNPELCRMLGYSHQEMLKLRNKGQARLTGIIHPDDRSAVFSFLESYQSYQGEEAREIVYRVKDASGEYRWITARYQVFKRNEAGLPIQIIGVSRDDTVCKQAEQLLKESQVRLQEAQSMAQLGHWELQLGGSKKLTWSAELYHIFGINPITELSLEVFAGRVHPQDWHSLEEKMEACSKSASPYEHTYRIVCPNGATKMLVSRGQAVKNTSGTIVCLRGITQDITQRNALESKLAESQLFKAVLADSIPHLVFLYDVLERKNIYANREITSLLGYAPDVLQQMGPGLMSRIIHPDDFAAVAERDSQIALGSDDQLFEVMFRARNAFGEWRWLRSVSRIFKRDAQGNPWQILGITEDVTERKGTEDALQENYAQLAAINQALSISQQTLSKTNQQLSVLTQELEQRVIQRTQALKESQQRYRMFIEQSSEGIGRYELADIGSLSIHLPVSEQVAMFYRHGYLAECNDALAQMYGYERAQDLTGTPLATFIPSATPAHINYLTAFIESGYRLTDMETMEEDRDGNTRYFLHNLVGFIEDDCLVRVWGTQRDVTPRRRAEEALRRSEIQLRLITDALPVLISYVDCGQRYRFNNKAYQEWFNLSQEQIYGKHLLELLGEQAYKHLEPTVTRVLKGERIHVESQIEYQRAGKRFVTVDYIPHLEQQEVKGFYALVTDISARKAAEQALEKALTESRQQNQVLEQINQDLDDFIYTACHDLRAPIANLEGIAIQLTKRLSVKLTKKEENLFGLASQCINRLKQTIDDLTQIAKVQREDSPETITIDFHEILREVKQENHSLIHQTNAVIRADFQVPSIFYVRENLKRILHNLLTNAIKYRSMERAPSIFVRTSKVEDFIVLSVEDNGLGISEHQLPKLFTMFKRLHAHVEGSGIGLYIVKRLVENKGGQIQVKSQEGIGSTFSIYFNTR